jgi:hypothetical protein
VAEQLDHILSTDYLGRLEQRDMNELRAMRAEVQEVETGLSYLRRLVQGRLDIVGGELHRRREGGEPGDLGELVKRLPEILSDHSRAPGLGRLPQLMTPGELDPDLTADLDAITTITDLESLSTLSDEELVDVCERLAAFEREVSGRRRAVFDRIDALQGEVTRRYKTGEASVESLLQ